MTNVHYKDLRQQVSMNFRNQNQQQDMQYEREQLELKKLRQEIQDQQLQNRE